LHSFIFQTPSATPYFLPSKPNHQQTESETASRPYRTSVAIAYSLPVPECTESMWSLCSQFYNCSILCESSHIFHHDSNHNKSAAKILALICCTFYLLITVSQYITTEAPIMYLTMGITFGALDSSVVSKRVTDEKIKQFSLFISVFMHQNYE
jgi:hypothetical protein